MVIAVVRMVMVVVMVVDGGGDGDGGGDSTGRHLSEQCCIWRRKCLRITLGHIVMRCACAEVEYVTGLG